MGKDKKKDSRFKKSIPHDITIKSGDNGGYIVTVGCKTLVYTDYRELLAHAKDYLKDPAKAEEKYFGGGEGQRFFFSGTPASDGISWYRTVCDRINGNG